MKNKLFIIFLFLFIGFEGYNQSNFRDILNTETNYNSVISSAEQFFETSQNRTVEKGYYDYLSWRSDILKLNSSAIDSLNGLPNLTEYIVDYASFEIPTTNRHPIDWSSGGPKQMESQDTKDQFLGQITAVAAKSDNEVYVGTGNGGIFKTLDGGQTWTCITDKKMQDGDYGSMIYVGALGITDIEIRGNTIYALAGTIDKKYNQLTRHSYSTGLIISTDLGQNWKYFETPLTSYDNATMFSEDVPLKLEVSAINPDYIVVMLSKKIYTSDDHGASWTIMPLISTFKTTLTDIELSAEHNNDEDLYYSYSDGTISGVYHYPAIRVISDIWTGPVSDLPIATGQNNTHCYALEYFDNTLFFGYKSGNTGYKLYMDDGSNVTHLYTASLLDPLYGQSEKEIVHELDIVFNEPEETVLYVISSGAAEVIRQKHYPSIDYFSESQNYNYNESGFRVNGSSSSNNYIWIGTNGGISRTQYKEMTGPFNTIIPPDLDPNHQNTPTYLWKNVNGEGLNIGQFNGISLNKNDKSIMSVGSQYNYYQLKDESGKWETKNSGLAAPNYFPQHFFISRIGDPVFNSSDNKFYYQGVGPIQGFNEFYGAFDVNSNTNSFFIDNQHIWGPNMASAIDNYNHIYFGNKWVYLYDKDNASRSDIFNWTGSSYKFGVNVIEFSETDDNIMWVANTIGIGNAQNGITSMEEKLYKISITNPTANTPTYTALELSTTSGTGKLQVNGNSIFIEAMEELQISDIEIDPNNSNIVYVSFNGFGQKGGFMRKRVFKTTDGGVNWVDISKGLPKVPVNAIFRIPNSISNEILAGTDMGVYYYSDQTNGQWEYTNLDNAGNIVLPIVPVTDFDFDIETNKVYISTYGRGVYVGQLECINESQLKTTFAVQNGQNVTWSNSSHVNHDIIIFSGGTLTINNGSVHGLGVDSRITIHPGGKLIVDNATLTSGCDDTWKGILIKGNSSLSQIPNSNQGVCILKNNAKIINAETGAYVESGGLLFANNTSFINNHCGVNLNTYQGFHGSLAYVPNRSYIKLSSFEWNNNIPVSFQNGGNGGIITGADGVKITGCNFEDNNNISQGRSNIGIMCLSGSYQLNSVQSNPITQTTYTRNTFKNLLYGISNNQPFFGIHFTTSSKKTTIDDAVFTNCYRSIYDRNQYSVITNNDISVPKFDPSMQVNPYTNEAKRPYGIYLDHSKYFKVEENTIQSMNTQGAYDLTIGIVVNNSLYVNNEIYNNELKYLTQGLLAINENRSHASGASASGLKILCNDFNNNRQDLRTSKFPFQSTNITGIHPVHKTSISAIGTPTIWLPAHNYFSHLGGSVPNTDIDNHQAAFLHYYHQYGTSSDPWVPVYVEFSPTFYGTPSQTGNEIKTHELFVQNPNSLCPSKLSTSTNPNDIITTRGGALQALNSAKLILNIWENGGIENLEEVIELTDPWDAYDQFNSLMLESPYLDEGVLVEIVNNPVFTALMVKLLLVANPQSATYQSVMDALAERTPALPESYVEEIMSGAGTTTQYDVLVSNVVTLQYEVDHLAAELKRIYYNDTLVDYSADLAALLLSENSVASHYELADYYFNEGNYTALNQVLNDIPSQFDLNAVQSEEHTRYMQYFSILQNLSTNNNDVSTLSQTELDQIDEMMEHGSNFYLPGLYSIYAQIDEEFVYDEPIYIPTDEPTARRPVNHTAVDEELGNQFAAYPNPANDFVTVDYKIVDNFTALELIIRDVSGREVLKQNLQGGSNQELINISSLSNGTYLIVIKGDGLIISSSKLTKVEK